MGREKAHLFWLIPDDAQKEKLQTQDSPGITDKKIGLIALSDTTASISVG